MVRRSVDEGLLILYHDRPKLILAAADFAAGHDVEPPSELVDLWDWTSTGTPKHAGGRDDQPAGLLRKGKYLDAVYRIMQRWYKHGSHDFNSAEQKLFKHVLELRKARNADTR